MKILYLGPQRNNMINFLKNFGDQILCSEAEININKMQNENFDFVISYGYRYILPRSFLNYYSNRVINMHISLLPWNRGADPNFWSFYDNTPKGVSIHYIDEGIDTGDIITQKEVRFTSKDTLTTSYNKLTYEIEDLFFKTWPGIRKKENNRTKQSFKGTYHRSSDKNRYLHLLKEGWDTKVSLIENRGEENG